MLSHNLPWVASVLLTLYTALALPANSAAVDPDAPIDGIVRDPVSLVNLFIGTTKGGHTFPGIVEPAPNRKAMLIIHQVWRFPMEWLKWAQIQTPLIMSVLHLQTISLAYNRICSMRVMTETLISILLGFLKCMTMVRNGRSRHISVARLSSVSQGTGGVGSQKWYRFTRIHLYYWQCDRALRSQTLSCGHSSHVGKATHLKIAQHLSVPGAYHGRWNRMVRVC